MELFLWIVIAYAVLNLGVYATSVVKTWEYVGIWFFGLENGHIGIYPYPKWSVFPLLETMLNKSKK